MPPKRSSTTTWSECAACLRRFTRASQAKQGAVSLHNEFVRQDASTHKNRPPKETDYSWRGEDLAQFVRHARLHVVKGSFRRPPKRLDLAQNRHAPAFRKL